MMRRIVTAVVVLLSLVVSSHSVVAVEPQGAMLELSTKEIDLGELYLDDDKQIYRLTFRNVGDVPLVITEVRTSCVCTTVQYDRKKVMPEAQGVLNITFDPRKASLGMLYRVLQVHSTSRGGVEYVTLKANILE
ncbi:MAG: DUF1573 domain-containing protein [Alistipes sp.]|nr:DUF1573 domain-containing protein [Alistipes sp.]